MSDEKTQPLPSDTSTPPSGPAPGANLGAVEINKAVERASATALSAAGLANAAKRKQGQRGPDKAPRKPRPAVARVATMAPRTSGPLVEFPDADEGFEVGVQPVPNVDQEKSERFFVEGCLDLLEELTGWVKSAAVFKYTSDKKLAEEAKASAAMGQGVRDKLQKSGAMLVRKYALDVRYAPELAFGGGLLVYLGRNVADVRAAKALAAAQAPAAVAP
jgi:hypothetical protein